MTKLIILALITFVTSAQNSAWAVDQSAFLSQAPYKFYAVNLPYNHGVEQVLTSEAAFILDDLAARDREIARLRFRIQQINYAASDAVRGWNEETKAEAAARKEKVAGFRNEIDRIKAEKVEVYGKDVDKLAAKLESRSYKLGKMWWGMQDEVSKAKTYGFDPPKVRTAAFKETEAEMTDLIKQLWKEDRIRKMLGMAPAKAKKLGRAKLGIAGAAVAAGALAIGASDSGAEASELKAEEFQANPNDKARSDVSIGAFDAQ